MKQIGVAGCMVVYEQVLAAPDAGLRHDESRATAMPGK